MYNSGFWDIKSTIIETFKIQSIIISQPVWHKKRNLGDIIFYTAGGYIKAKTYDFSELKNIVNRSIYSVEISNKKWMQVIYKTGTPFEIAKTEATANIKIILLIIRIMM